MWISSQAGLTGCAGGDVSVMFEEDSVAHHLSTLFDGKPLTRSVSASERVGHQAAFISGPSQRDFSFNLSSMQAAMAASTEGSHTSQDQLASVVRLTC